MKRQMPPILAALIALASAAATAADSTPNRNACEVMPESKVGKRAGAKVASVNAYDFMDAMQIYRCDYSLQNGAGLIGFIVMDYSQLNPDPSMRPGTPNVSPPGCYTFKVKTAVTRLCSVTEPTFTLSFSGPANLLSEKAALKLVNEAAKRWAKK